MSICQAKCFLRIISLFLILTLISPAFLSVAALENLQANGNSISPELRNTNAAADISDSDRINLIKDEDIPTFLSQQRIAERKHILRLPDEETDNTLMYLNADGSKTLYIASSPIKYIDQETGNLKFIDLSLLEESDHYITAANNITISAFKDYSRGVTISCATASVGIVPLQEVSSDFGKSASTTIIPTVVANNEAITYKNAFGAGIHLRYTPLFNGVKEDIILESRTDKNTFSFLLHTNGQSIYKDSFGLYIAATEYATERFYIGEIVAYDASLKMVRGDLTFTPIKPKQTYGITISVDQSFLNDLNTVYPVVIDPTLTVSDNTHESNAIIDAPVYSGLPSQNFGSYSYNPVGYIDDTYQIGRTAIKLSGLINSSVYATLSADAVEDVKFYIHDSSGGQAQTIQLFALENISSWAESDITWNDTLGNISSVLQASATLGGGTWSSFDITTLVKGWKNGTFTAACGFIMQGASETVCSNFYSSETSSSYQPYIVMTYRDSGSGGGDSFSSAETIHFGESATIHTVITNEKRYFKFIPSMSREYLFYSVYESGDPKIWLYDENQTLIASNDDGGGAPNFRLTAMLSAGNTYYLELGHFTSRTGLYDLHILRDANISNDIYNLQNIATTYYLDIHGPIEQELLHQWSYHTGEQLKWAIEKDSTGYYTIQSLYGDKKYAAIYDAVTGTDTVVLIPSITNYALWRIFEDGDGYLYLEPKVAEGKTLYAPTYAEGDELQLVLTASNSSSRNLWSVDRVESSEPHTHSYTLFIEATSSHPHEAIMRCECGATETRYDIKPACSVCKADEKTVSNQVMEVKVFAGLDSDAGSIAPGIYTVECYVEYVNYYFLPSTLIANYPKFATHISVVTSHALPTPESPSVICTSSRVVNYCSSSGTILMTQQLQPNGDSISYYPTNSSTSIPTLNTIPSHTTTGAVFTMPSLGQFRNVDITTYFT